MAVIGIVLLTIGSTNPFVWPILLVMAGVVVLIINLIPKQAQ